VVADGNSAIWPSRKHRVTAWEANCSDTAELVNRMR
jgi:hypothetical protein